MEALSRVSFDRDYEENDVVLSKVESLLSKRRDLHFKALKEYEDRIQSIHESIEVELFELSNGLKLSIEGIEVEIKKVYLALENEYFTLSCYEEDVR